MTAKLRLKTRGLEIEWEGDVAFLKTEVPQLIASIIEAMGPGSIDEGDDADAGTNNSRGGTQFSATFTTASAAAKLQSRTGPDLFKAALLKLQASDAVEPAQRTAILDEMKKAPRVYKPSMRSNLTKIIDGLLDQGEINEPSSGNFVLSHSTYEDMMRNLNS